MKISYCALNSVFPEVKPLMSQESISVFEQTKYFPSRVMCLTTHVFLTLRPLQDIFKVFLEYYFF